MELREYIDAGIRKTGTAKELAKHLGLAHASYIANARGGQRGLPNAACYKLADLIGVTRDEVIAASELVTEKDEGLRAFWRPFVETARHAHQLMIATIAIASAFSLDIANSLLIGRDFLL